MKTRRLTFAFIILAAMLSLAACGGTSPEPTPTPAATTRTGLKISGSATTTRLLTALKPAFEADTPGYQLETLTGSGTGGGVEGILKEVLDVAAMGRLPKEEEATQIEFVPLGFGPEVPIAHPSVGIESLSSEEFISIFAGEVTNWSQSAFEN
jgi:ABC-type phosphate transport system substrate-binding protein